MFKFLVFWGVIMLVCRARSLKEGSRVLAQAINLTLGTKPSTQNKEQKKIVSLPLFLLFVLTIISLITLSIIYFVFIFGQLHPV